MEIQGQIQTFIKWIKESSNIVFFGGAGVSTESGIPDFRSVDGIYNQDYRYPPETILSHTFYVKKPEEFFEFYKKKMLFPEAEPSTTHKKLAELEKCGKFYNVNYVIDSAHIPVCICGGRVKPDVILYEEGLNENNMREAINLISEADVLIIGGTSLGVYPAAGLIDYYKGNKLVLINKSATPYDKRADLLINDSLGKVFQQVSM